MPTEHRHTQQMCTPRDLPSTLSVPHSREALTSGFWLVLPGVPSSTGCLFCQCQIVLRPPKAPWGLLSHQGTQSNLAVVRAWQKLERTISGQWTVGFQLALTLGLCLRTTAPDAGCRWECSILEARRELGCFSSPSLGTRGHYRKSWFIISPDPRWQIHGPNISNPSTLLLLCWLRPGFSGK